LEEIGMAIMRGDESRALDYLERIFAGSLLALMDDLIHVASNSLVPGRNDKRSDKERMLAIDCLCKNPDGSLKDVSSLTFMRLVEITVQEQPAKDPDELTAVSLHIQDVVCRLVDFNRFSDQFVGYLTDPRHSGAVRRGLCALIRPALGNPKVAMRLAEEIGSGPQGLVRRPGRGHQQPHQKPFLHKRHLPAVLSAVHQHAREPNEHLQRHPVQERSRDLLLGVRQRGSRRRRYNRRHYL